MKKSLVGFNKAGREKPTPNYIIDASVVLKWVLPDEKYQEKADKLKHNFLSGEIQLFAPSFITQETANALWIAVKQRRIQQTDAIEALKFLQDTQLSLCELNWTDVSQTLAIACKLDVAVYDAAYLFVCDKIGAQLITADNKLFEKAKEHFKVTHIRDL
jgi:predicted nucleic acid-binding protein